MSVWFTADTHFGHENIIKFCNRPFADKDEMNKTMVDRWNAVVGHDDLVYHLGDFAFTDPWPFLVRLNGRKRLILGNHDHKRIKSKHIGGSGKLEAINTLEEISLDGEHIVLCHYGMRVWNHSHHGALHFYGHSHGGLPGNSQSCDVGVDEWDFKPVSLTQIKARLSRLAKRNDPAITDQK